MNSFDALARCAAAACGASVVVVAVIERERAVIKANIGVPPAESLFDSRLFARTQIVDVNGKLLGMLLVGDTEARELTEQQAQALRELASLASEFILMQNLRLLSRAIDEALDFVIITDFTPPSQGGPFIQYANVAFLLATGYGRDELIGKPYSAILSENNDPLALETIARNLEAAVVNEKEIRLRRKDGSSFWVEFTGKPLPDGDGSDGYWVAVGRDITLRRQTHEQLAALTTAIDAVSGHLEIYTLENGDYSVVFQNAQADSDISELVETLLNEPAIREASGLRARLSAGENVTVTNDGLQIRPIGKNGETLIAIKQKAS
jgi:PAS domain S-box-containing protein